MYVALGAAAVFVVAGVAVGTGFAIEDRREWNRNVEICRDAFDQQSAIDECVSRLED